VLRKPGPPVEPVLLLVGGTSWPSWSCATSCSTTSASRPFHPAASWRPGSHLLTSGGRAAVLLSSVRSWWSTAPLVLNLETYQAASPDDPLDLTYMEYELLKFLAQNPAGCSPARCC
jgi:hypothetical protein